MFKLADEGIKTYYYCIPYVHYYCIPYVQRARENNEYIK